MLKFDEIWRRVEAHEGEVFHQIRGGEFTYSISGTTLVPNRTTQNLPQSAFSEAFKLAPLENTREIQHLRGPSYLYAILMDPRIRKSDY